MSLFYNAYTLTLMRDFPAVLGAMLDGQECDKTRPPKCLAAEEGFHLSG